ncbi:unnamed protein product [Bursaphelenchus xylophilus]|uniref:(pine wood nematode) hypothetical protein n=1 Tax=Bursaphelenchus xylophilus TaxID=6326 RepID=A0A1I7RWE8_BURXY|nr:unnamed protein product [Bursaphelenchus xylophilus]CAG9095556.1 unnamed protein product [Bursaphelenchus xylophilus]
MGGKTVRLEVATPKDADLMFELAMVAFAPDEPTSGALANPREEVGDAYREAFADYLQYPYSIIAFDGDKPIAYYANKALDVKDLKEKEEIDVIEEKNGNVIGRPKKDLGPEIDEVNKTFKSREGARLVALLNHFDLMTRNFIPKDATKLYRQGQLGVIREYRQQQLTPFLFKKHAQLGVEAGFKYIDGLFTASGTEAYALNAGMKHTLEVPYKEFMDHGERIYKKPIGDGKERLTYMIGHVEEMARYKVEVPGYGIF